MAINSPYQNFPGIQSMTFQRKRLEQLPYQKLGRFIAAFGSYRPKTLKTVNFAPKWPNFGLKWPKFRHIRIFPAYRV